MWTGDQNGPDVISKSVGHRLAAIWPMPHDNYWIVLTHDFSREKTKIVHLPSLEKAKEWGETFLNL